MADIYQVNAENIVGGPGRLVYKPWDGNYPRTISEVMDPNQPEVLLAGFRDLGATVEGIVISRGFETEDFSVDQLSSPVDTDITGWTHSLSTTLAENSVENRQLALIGGTIIETAPVLGTATTTVTETRIGGTLINVTSATGFSEGGYLSVDGDIYRIISVSGNAISIHKAVQRVIPAGTSISPVTELGTRRIGYGTPAEIPIFTYALISQKKSGALYMAVFRKCKVTGDSKEQTFNNSKRTLPLNVVAYPDSNVNSEENVYFEVEQMA